MKVESLRLADDNVPDLWSSKHLIMIRNGLREFQDDIDIAGRHARLVSYRYTTAADLSYSELADLNYESRDKLLSHRQALVPNTTMESPVTVVRFRWAPRASG